MKTKKNENPRDQSFLLPLGMAVSKGQLKRVNRARETIWRLSSIDFSEKNPEFSAGELISFRVSLYSYTKSPIPR